MTPLILSIGTTHPWNVAGLGRDIQIATEYGLASATVVVAVSAQDERGLLALHVVPADVVRAQLQAVPLARLGAVRVGALAGAENVTEVARFLRALAPIPAVVDPVLEPSSSGRFADDATQDAIAAHIVSAPVIVTPNISEAQRFLARSITTVEQMVEAASELRSRGAAAVLLKGGHLAGAEVCDVLASAGGTHVFRSERIPRDMRGTGCTLAAAMACELARGAELQPAVRSARTFLREKLRGALL